MAPLSIINSTLGCCGTPVGNHWFTEMFVQTTNQWRNYKFEPLANTQKKNFRNDGESGCDCEWLY